MRRIGRGFSFVEILISILLMAIITVSIQQYLTIAMVGSESTSSNFQCMVAANNLMESGMASREPLLTSLISLIGAAAVDEWQPLPSDFVPAGSAVGFRAMVSRRPGAIFDGVVTTGAAVTIVDDQFQETAIVQGYREPLE